MNLFWTQSVLVALEPVCGIERRVLKGISDVRRWTGNEFFCSQQQFCLEKASLLLWGLHELTCFVNSLGLIRILLLPVAHQTSHNCVNHWPCREQHCYWKRNRKTSHMPMRAHTHTPLVGINIPQGIYGSTIFKRAYVLRQRMGRWGFVPCLHVSNLYGMWGCH